MLSPHPSMLFSSVLYIISIIKLIQVLKYLFLILLILFHGTTCSCEDVKITVLLKKPCFIRIFLVTIYIRNDLPQHSMCMYIYVYKLHSEDIHTYIHLYAYDAYILCNHNKSKNKLKRTKCSVNEGGQASWKPGGCAALEQRMLMWSLGSDHSWDGHCFTQVPLGCPSVQVGFNV